MHAVEASVIATKTLGGCKNIQNTGDVSIQKYVASDRIRLSEVFRSKVDARHETERCVKLGCVDSVDEERGGEERQVERERAFDSILS